MSFQPVDPAAEPPHIIYQPLPPARHARGQVPARAPHRLVLFVPGNPGCISFYGAFLATLAQELLAPGQDAPPAASLTVVGVSLANFSKPRDGAAPFSLRGQIEFVEAAVAKWVRWVAGAADGAADAPRAAKHAPPADAVHVTLIGHSVGAYICMEVLSRWKWEIGSLAAGTAAEEALRPPARATFRISSFIGLWPTITHIAQSPSGLRFANVLRFAHLAMLVSWLAGLLVTIIPRFLLLWIVGRVTGFPPSATETTAAFLSRPYSVRQALHMARDEMNEIAEDRWADDLWHAGKDGPRLSFLFGDEDHWVSADDRELLLRSRRTTRHRPGAIMNIDETRIPHSFCIRDSAAVAERTAQMVREIQEGVHPDSQA